MFQSRRFNPVLQHTTPSGADLRRPWSLARAGLISVSLLALAACGNSGEDPALVESEDDTRREVYVTAAFESTNDSARALAFVPSTMAPSLGMIVSATRDGGLELFDADGALRTSHAGAELTALAAAPGFQLRGEALPLVFGSAADGSGLLGYAITPDFEIFDLPLDAIATDSEIRGVCLFGEGIGYVDLIVLEAGNSALVARVQDRGDAQLSVETVDRFDLPSPARSCTVLNDDIYFAAPASGIARVSRSGEVLAERMELATGIASDNFNGTPVVLTVNGNNGIVLALDAETLLPRANFSFVDGLSTPGLETATRIALTDQSYGFTAYSDGILAFFDRSDSRIKVVSREATIRSFFVSE
ncbi:hypothetical protein [Maricaulis sp.]|uniref:hypothetical protein n=1 Tax=Maricaulis sp. TaxID=1486257 RepID=UPI002603DE81|nr:hypothetical protein [Maricaulis sp.]